MCIYDHTVIVLHTSIITLYYIRISNDVAMYIMLHMINIINKSCSNVYNVTYMIYIYIYTYDHI